MEGGIFCVELYSTLRLVAAAVVATATVAALVATAIVLATAAAAALRSQILGLYVAYANNLNLEVEHLASHRVVEVHLHGLLANLADSAEHTVTLVIAHRYLITNEQHLLSQLAIDHKDIFGQIDDSLSDHLAVAIFGLECECHLVANLFAEDSLLELGEQHTRSEDKFEGVFGVRLVSDLTINRQFVIYRYKFVLFYFHRFVLFIKSL